MEAMFWLVPCKMIRSGNRHIVIPIKHLCKPSEAPPILQMASTAASNDGAPEGFPFQLLPTHGTVWTPSQAKVTLSARMDARLVPSPASPGGNALQFSTGVSLHAGRCHWLLRVKQLPLNGILQLDSISVLRRIKKKRQVSMMS